MDTLACLTCDKWYWMPSAQVTKFRRRKETLFSDFQAEIAQQWGVPVQQQRLWLCKDRSNATVRVHRPIEPAEYSQRVSAILPTNQGAQHPQRDPHEKGLLLYLGECPMHRSRHVTRLMCHAEATSSIRASGCQA